MARGHLPETRGSGGGQVHRPPRTTAELARLCATPPSDPGHAQAVQFCRGFAAGVLAQHRIAAAPGPWGCDLPAAERPRVLQRFAAWVQANPMHLNDAPARSLMLFLDLHAGCRR